MDPSGIAAQIVAMQNQALQASLAVAATKQADIVILTLGGKHGTCSMASMGEGIDSTDINLPKCQDAFIRKAAQLGKPLVGVHFDGRITSGKYVRHSAGVITPFSAVGSKGTAQYTKSIPSKASCG